MNKTVIVKKSCGFSLLEILVALAIFAVVSVATYQQVSASATTAERLEEKSVALWVAENNLEQYFIDRQWPLTGEDIAEVSMSHREWKVVTRVSNTENENIRQLESKVYRKGDSSNGSSIITVTRLISRN